MAPRAFDIASLRWEFLQGILRQVTIIDGTLFITVLWTNLMPIYNKIGFVLPGICLQSDAQATHLERGPTMQCTELSTSGLMITNGGMVFEAVIKSHDNSKNHLIYTANFKNLSESGTRD